MTKHFLLILSSILFLFILFIQFQNPGQSLSEEETLTTDTVNNAITDQSSGNAVIGQIKTRDKIIIIRSGDDDRLYTVKSRDGDLLAADLNARELYAQFPELKDVIEKGLAGDATLRTNNGRDDKVSIQIDNNK